MILGQPGLFIAQRPFLSALLTLSVLGLFGFAGGGLLADDVLSGLPERLNPFVALTAFVSVFYLLPTVVPERKWARTVLAAGILSAGVMISFLGGPPQNAGGPELPVVPIMLVSVAAASLVMLQPYTGRLFTLAAILSPFTGLIGLAALTGFFIRLDVPQTETIIVAQTLGFAVALLAGAYLTSSLSRIAMNREVGSRMLAGLTFNRVVRDLIYWSLAAAIFFTFFLDQPMVADAGMSAGWLGLLFVLIASVPVAVLASCAASIWTPTGLVARSKDWADINAARMSLRVLSRITPASFIAAFAIAVILALAFLLETPVSTYAESELGITVPGSVFLALLFYVLIFALTSLVYLSLRMAALVGVTLMVSDILTAGVLHAAIGADRAATDLIDIAPRLLVLLMIVRIARNWADILHNRQIARQQIAITYAKASASAIAGILFCIVAFSGLSILAPALSESANYMAIRLAFQSLICLLLLPTTMAVFARLKFSL